jgi:hypothetical protein
MRQRGGSEQPIEGRSANSAHKVSIAAPSIADLQNALGSLARELKEACEQQTATAEVLSGISAVPADPKPVFEVIVRRAVTLCGSQFANVFRFDGEGEGGCTGVGAAIASAVADALGRSAPVGSIPLAPRRLRDLLALSSDSP